MFSILCTIKKGIGRQSVNCGRLLLEASRAPATHHPSCSLCLLLKMEQAHRELISIDLNSCSCLLGDVFVSVIVAPDTEYRNFD